MSFGITLQAISNATIGTFEREIVWGQFQTYAHPSPQGYDLWFAGNYGGSLYIEDSEQIGGFSLDRPSDAAVQNLFEIAKKRTSLIMWDDGFAVADASFLAEIPDMLLVAFGKPPAVVDDYEDLLRLIAES